MNDKTLASIFEDEDNMKKTRLERKMEKKKAKEKKIYDDFIEEQKTKSLDKTSGEKTRNIKNNLNQTKKITDDLEKTNISKKIDLEKTTKLIRLV